MGDSLRPVRIRGSALPFAVIAAVVAGCAGPGPVLFPVTPLSVRVFDNGVTERYYDTNGDGRPDCSERVNPSGLIDTLRYDDNKDGCLDNNDPPIVLADIAPSQRRHLVIIVDSLPYHMMESAWLEGRFRLFHRPSRVISPFPVMTDLCLSDFFNRIPCPGVESAYFDGRELRNGYLVYASKENVPWMAYVDWHLEPISHPYVYLGAMKWYPHELRQIQDHFRRSTRPLMIGYSVGTSALGARIGRNGHQFALIELDRLCQQIMFENRGTVQFSLFSDHGHHLGTSHRIPLSEVLTTFGYRVRDNLERPGDVVVPEFGMVTCAALHTREPQEVARDVLGIEGVELTAYPDAADRVVILSRTGRASIVKSGNAFAYRSEFGDPLELKPILEDLRRQGKMDETGFVDDRDLMNATSGHTFPDAIHRLWRGFHDLVKHTPDVLVSTNDGYHCGSRFMSSVVQLTAAHGNLRQASSTAFAMSTAGELPEMLRMEELRAALVRQNVPLEDLRPVE